MACARKASMNLRIDSQGRRVKEGEQGHLRQMEEYGANWSFGVKGTF